MKAAPQEEIDRLDALACCRIIGTPPEPEFDALARLAALLTDSPLAWLTLVDAERVWVKAAYGRVPGGDYPRTGSPCELTLRERGLFEIPELERQLGDHALVAGTRAYAAVPLVVGKSVLGTLAVVARSPRSLNDVQREHLITLGRQASALLELRRLREPRQLKREELRYSATRISGIGCWQWDLQSGEVLLSDEMLTLFGVEPSRTFGYE
ncbi:MAG TPA: GAF domain-containing protein, partial [Polyangiales bacterium]|nr:GAF domain-containing protein [Polyangiales bacterium]